MPFSSLSAPYAALRVCVDETGPGGIAGLVYSQRLTMPLPFADLGSLFLRLDEVMDQQKFPQAFQKGRSFSAQGYNVPAAKSPEEGLPPETVEAARGKACTLVLYILARRSSSWQGTVEWLPGGGALEFSSALELMRMIEARGRE